MDGRAHISSRLPVNENPMVDGNEKAPIPGMVLKPIHAPGNQIRTSSSSRSEAHNSANLKTRHDARKFSKKEETQVVLDTQLATAALDFQLSSDPPSPHQEQRSWIKRSAPQIRLEFPESGAIETPLYPRTKQGLMSPRGTVQKVSPSSSDDVEDTSLFLTMLDTEQEAYASKRLSTQRASQIAEEESDLSFNSASADTDYRANDSLFLAAIEAEGKEVASISPKIATVHRASSEEEFFDARSSFTMA